MNREDMLEAIGNLDDDLILEADEKPTRRTFPVWQAATAAAATVMVCVGVYLWPAMQPAGMAAPESQGTDNTGLMNDVADVAGGVLADGTLEDYEYKTNSESALRAPSAANKDGTGATQGVFEPVFRTEQGRYLLVGEELPIKSKLPDDVQYLGELAATDHDKPVYPSVGTKELVGCPVWQSKDGDYLYIQRPAGGWLQATRQE